MPPPLTDAQFLFGVLAYHNGLVTKEALLDALRRCNAGGGIPLRDILRGQGALSYGRFTAAGMPARARVVLRCTRPR